MTDSITILIAFAAGAPAGAVIGYLISSYRRSADIHAAEKRTWRQANAYYDIKSRHQ